MPDMDPKPTAVYKISETWQQETAALDRFIRALRKDDADLLKEILAEAKQIFADIGFAGMNPLSMHVLCIEMVRARRLKTLVATTNQPKSEELDSTNVPSLEWYKPNNLAVACLRISQNLPLLSIIQLSLIRPKGFRVYMSPHLSPSPMNEGFLNTR